MLEPEHVLEGLLHDDYHEYIKKITHLHSWQFFYLADCLKDLILRPRDNNQSVKVGPAVKHDHHHQLFFALKWLNDGNFHRTREAEFRWSKMSLQHDLEHVLHAIVEGLDDEFSGLVLIIGLSWPMYILEFFTVVLELEMWRISGCQVPGSSEGEALFSREEKINSYKFLSIMDHSG
jgi:hypothetical protein